jgi:hypothetical protein
MRGLGLSPSCTDRSETSVGEDSDDYFALVALNFDPSLFHGAPCATSLLHLFGEPFFFSQSDASETGDDRHGLASSMGSLTNDIHSPAILLWCDSFHVM